MAIILQGIPWGTDMRLFAMANLVSITFFPLEQGRESGLNVQAQPVAFQSEKQHQRSHKKFKLTSYVNRGLVLKKGGKKRKVVRRLLENGSRRQIGMQKG